jgi:hypothetical protein
MSDRVLGSNPDKTNLLQLSPTSEPCHQSTNTNMEPTSSTSTSSITTDLQMVMQMLQKMQVDANNGFLELKEEFTNRVNQVNVKVEQLTSRIEQGERYRIQEMKNIQEQIDAMKLAKSTTPLVTDQSSTTDNGPNAPQIVQADSMSHMQSQNLLRMALDKQIDELKPYYGKKQENVDSWIKKIDKLAEIAKMPDEEVFMLAKLKLQGDADKCWDNKKKEIDSWITLKSK